MRQQQEKVQVTTRLMTMGEMASSVAHELNQPLTAISNYCNGMVSRLRDGNVVGRATCCRRWRRPQARPSAPATSSAASASS